MSDTPINGGEPAFPVVHSGGVASWGLSTRDYFAAKAMQGLLSAPIAALGDSKLVPLCYEIADAMIKARSA